MHAAPGGWMRAILLPSGTDNLGFAEALGEQARRVNAVLTELLDGLGHVPPRLAEAMRYTLDAPGKRIRAAVVLWSCEAVCGRVVSEALTAAAAVEMVHTYSLVHDDLPAMDDDDLRRGRPTCHKAFDEATAILTGDALLTLAFEVLARRVADPVLAVAMVRTLASAAGPEGMIAGQVEDVLATGTRGDLELLERIHCNKTARMFAAAARMGGLAGGAEEPVLDGLTLYGLKIGLGFQVADDILDQAAGTDQLGKTAGKDAEQGKLTYPSLIGLDRARRTTKELTEQALDALRPLGSAGHMLGLLARELLERTR